MSFSTAPLKMATALGSIVSVISLLYMVIRVVIAMIWGNPVAGYPSLLAITLCLGGFTRSRSASPANDAAHLHAVQAAPDLYSERKQTSKVIT